MQQTRSDRLARNNRKRKRLLHKYAIMIGIWLLLLAGVFYIWHAQSNRGEQHSQSDLTAPIADQVEDPTSEPSEEDADVKENNTDKPSASSNEDTHKTPAEPDERTVRLALVGDIMMGGRIDTLLNNHGYDYPFRELGTLVTDADLALGNLENPITDRGEPSDKSYVFRTSPEAVPAIKASGFDLFNLANNHTLDYGMEGLRDTIRYLDEAGLGWMGAGENEEEAFAPYFIEINGIRIACIGLTRVVPEVSWKADKLNPGLAETYDYTRALAAIEKADEEADLVVVMVHWGVERQETPEPYMVEYAHRYIDAGADLVVGSHPHVLQGIEHYQGKWIAYSLGNFIFTVSPRAKTRESAVLQADCAGNGNCELTLIPMETGVGQPYPASEEAAEMILDKMNRLSVGAQLTKDNDRLIVTKNPISDTTTQGEKRQ